MNRFLAAILIVGTLGLASFPKESRAQSPPTNAPAVSDVNTNGLLASGANWNFDLSTPLTLLSAVGSNIDIGNGVGIPISGKFALKYDSSQGIRLGSIGKGNWQLTLEFIHSLEFGSTTTDQVGMGLVTRHISTAPTSKIIGGITHTTLFQEWAASVAVVHQTDDLVKGHIRGDEARIQLMLSAKLW